MSFPSLPSSSHPQEGSNPGVPGATTRTLPSQGGLRVLVVEDEDPVRHFMERALQHLGHCVRALTGVREALAAFDAEAFDVVLSDLRLKDGDNGEQLANEIARRAPGTPMLIMTGEASHLVEGVGLPDGVLAVLRKPVRLHTLATMLAACAPR
jgi:DNA-binding NtrC family response regulator